MHAAFAAVGPTALLPATTALTYDDLLPGCFDQAHRLADMDANHTEASLCFPTVPRFCGQLFLNRRDMELAHLCVRAYNDFMIDEWCAGAGRRPVDPVDARPSVGRRSWPRPRCAGAPTWARMRWRSPRARRTSASEHPHRRVGAVLRRVRRDEHGHQHAHRFVVEAVTDVAGRSHDRHGGAHVGKLCPCVGGLAALRCTRRGTRASKSP